MDRTYPKIQYYLVFLYYKLRIFIDCRSGRMQVYLAEIIHLVNCLFRTSFEMPHHDRVGMIETIFGKFTFIADNYGYSILSPAFERPDIELFILQIRESLEQGNRVLFLDIGANVGLYSIGLTTRIGKKRFTTYAFEPDPVYHTLLLNNIAANDIKDVIVYNVAVGNGQKTIETDGFHLDKDKVEKTRVRFWIRTVDSIVTPTVLRGFDQIFVKIDIEGNEENAMDGAKNLLNSGKKIHLMIEDCVNPSIIDYLHAHDFRFIKKITQYDSFWEKN